MTISTRNPAVTTTRKHVECENRMRIEMIEITNIDDLMIMDDSMIMIDLIHAHRDSQVVVVIFMTSNSDLKLSFILSTKCP